jgi:hypothetical protein
MRAAFGLLVMVVVMAVVLWGAKQQAERLKVAPVSGAPAASASAPETLPKAVEKQVQELLNQAAEQRASEGQ